MRDVMALGLMLAIGLGATAAAAPLGGQPDLDQLAGVYKHPAAPGFGGNEGVRREDILEVVKLSPRTAYVRVHTEDGNHICGFHGVADLAPDALVYRTGRDSNPPCTLKLRSNREGVVLDDVGGGCSRRNCGVGADLGIGEIVSFKFSEKRQIRYLDRLLKSREYVQAAKEHGGRP